MLINLTDVSYGYDDTLIFYGVTASINEGDRIGLVGINGAGKTTLLHVLMGDYECVDGEVFRKNGLKIGYLRQNSGLDHNVTVYDEMNAVFSEVDDISARITSTAERMSQVEHGSDEYRRLGYEYNKLTARMDAIDGYNKDVRIKTVLNGMGFVDCYNQIISTMSGGEKTRLALAKLLLESPDLLILDEPTNHLDFKTLQWLEGYLSTYKGSLLIVSHDRYFLDKTVDKIWEIEDCTFSTYRGNYTKYRILKQENVTTRMREYIRQSEKMLKMKEFAERNIHRASTSKMAKSRLKALEKMDTPEKPRTYRKPPQLAFTYPEGDLIHTSLVLDGLDVGVENRQLISHAELEVAFGDRIGILGPNGAGKSTLIKKLLNDRGNRNIRWGKHTTLSYYDQENLNINFDNTVLEELWGRFPRETQTYIRGILGRVGLGGDDDVEKKVAVLSGGERARLGLAIIMAEKSNTLLLDEPTNHLDLLSMEALEKALRKYTGTVIFVSHDRYFINSVATKIVEIEDKHLNLYVGNYDKYVEDKKLESENQAKVKAQEVKSAPVVKHVSDANHKTTEDRVKEARLRQRLHDIEQSITALEEREKTLIDDMAKPEIAGDFDTLKSKCEELEQVRHDIDTLTAEWEQLI